MKALCDAYIFYKVDRFDIKGRQHFKTLGKYYIVHTGIQDHFPKVLLTLDEVPKNANFNGIRHLNLIDWLLE